MKSILVVDDDESVASLIVDFIRSRGGYFPVLARSGKEAWELMNGKMLFDIVLSDKDMPNWGGLDLLCRIRADRRFDSVRFILMSGNPPGNLEELQKQFHFPFLHKPFTPPELFEALG
ncbi:MAG: response regulator [Candidatus Zambryskibacteria bacterium]|nr:response regulator [Candidatus Zambryskibacteria bacterium]